MLIGSDEIARLLKGDRWVTVGVGGLVSLSVLGVGNEPAKLILWGSALFVLGVAVAWRGWSVPAVGWVVGPVYCLVALHRLGPGGAGFDLRSPALLAVLPLWAGDIAAIFAGRAFGRRPLAPAISPKKTVEGALANLLAATAAGAGLALACGWPLLVGSLAGLLCGTLGQAGDLFESGLKRRAGVKDSGTLLPGHGGVLDRVDSILMSAPAVAALWLFAHP